LARAEEKAEMRSHISQFFSRALKGAFPEMENYHLFRSSTIGFHDCLELPALGIIFAFRERMPAEEWLITAQQCGVVLPDTIQDQIAYSITRAGQEATRGKPIVSTPCCPT